jgi:hypothetical protein
MRILLSIAILLSAQLHAQVTAQSKVIAHPMHMAIDSKDNLYVTMKYGIGRIAPDGTFTDLRNLEGGQAIDFNMETAGGIVIDSKDNLYLANGPSIHKIKVYENRIEKTGYAGYSINSKYGLDDGPLTTATLQNIYAIAIDKDDNLYITQHYSWIRDKLTDPGSYITDPYIKNVPKNKAARNYHFFRKISAGGMVSTLKTPDDKYILANTVSGLVVNGTDLYYASQESRSVEKINLATGAFSHIAGKAYKRQYCPVHIIGDTSKAELFTPGFMISDKKGGLVYSDLRNHRITKIANGKVTTLAGNNIIDPCSQNIGGRAQEGHKDGKALSALFNFPIGLAYDSKGNLFIADRHNMCIRKLSTDSIVSSFTTFDRSMAMISTY